MTDTTASAGSTAHKAGGTAVALRHDEHSRTRARNIVEEHIAEGIAAINRVAELEASLHRQDAMLALADDRVLRLAADLTQSRAERDGYMRFGASAAQSLELIGAAVRTAGEAIRESGHVIDRLVSEMREQADRLHHASHLIDSLSGIIENAKADARNAALKPPEIPAAPAATVQEAPDALDEGAEKIGRRLGAGYGDNDH